MIWIQALSALTVCGAIVADVVMNNRKQKSHLCDYCINLKRKDPSQYLKYDCTQYGKFKSCPEFCGYYKLRPKEEKPDDDNDWFYEGWKI